MVTRRAVIGGAAGVGAAIALPAITTSAFAGTETPAGTAARTIPSTMARRGDALRGGGTVNQSSFRLSHLVVSWSGSATPSVRLKTASGWGDWQAVHATHGGKDGESTTTTYGLLNAPGAVGYELDGGSATLTATELNTVDGPVRATAAPAAKSLELAGRGDVPCRYLSRAAWGADESYRFKPDGSLAFGPTQFFPVQTLTVHHTAGANDDPDPAATVRAIYYYDAITQGWGDFGYHLAIDEGGTVYEGRWSGDDPLPIFDTTPDADGRLPMVTAAHIGGWNSGNIGVVLLGDFTSRQPTAAARSSLTGVLALLSTMQVLDPLGITNYVNPINGTTKTVTTISGHRDWAATECPGNDFYPQFDSLRQDVSKLVPNRK